MYYNNKLLITYLKESRTPGRPRGIVDSLFDIQDEERAAGEDVVLTDERIAALILEAVVAGEVNFEHLEWVLSVYL